MPKQTEKLRGIYEKAAGSGVWWISYFDSEGRRRREKAGSRGTAVKLYQKRKTDIHEGKKLPDNFRSAGAKFKVLAGSIIEYSKNHHTDSRNVESRVNQILPDFGERIANNIKPNEIDAWIIENTRTAATANRYRAVFSLIFREALRNGKVSANPARLVKQRREGNGRVRWMKDDEEKSLRKVIANLYPDTTYLDELTISLGTGMRLSEQFNLVWKQVDFKRKEVHLLKTKNGDARDVPMNSEVIAAFERMKLRTGNHTRVFPADNPRAWFEVVREHAGMADYVWHCNRHTFCSRLVAAGVGLKTVQVLAGHKTISMTARYSHLAPNTLHAAVETITVESKSGTRSGTSPKTTSQDAEMNYDDIIVCI
jgi:integrase